MKPSAFLYGGPQCAVEIPSKLNGVFSSESTVYGNDGCQNTTNSCDITAHEQMEDGPESDIK